MHFPASRCLDACPYTRSSIQPGKLIYNLYGQKTEEAFVKNWGVGLALEQAQSFQDLVNDAGKVRKPALLQFELNTQYTITDEATPHETA